MWGVVEGALAFVRVAVRVSVVAGGAGDGGGGAAGGGREGVGFFSGAAVVGRFGADHVEGLGVEAGLWERLR